MKKVYESEDEWLVEKLFGADFFLACQKYHSRNFDMLQKHISQLMSKNLREGKTFCMYVRRSF